MAWHVGGMEMAWQRHAIAIGMRATPSNDTRKFPEHVIPLHMSPLRLAEGLMGDCQARLGTFSDLDPEVSLPCVPDKCPLGRKRASQGTETAEIPNCAELIVLLRPSRLRSWSRGSTCSQPASSPREGSMFSCEILGTGRRDVILMVDGEAAIKAMVGVAKAGYEDVRTGSSEGIQRE